VDVEYDERRAGFREKIVERLLSGLPGNVSGYDVSDGAYSMRRGKPFLAESEPVIRYVTVRRETYPEWCAGIGADGQPMWSSNAQFAAGLPVRTYLELRDAMLPENLFIEMWEGAEG
jgi:hypothetical protein